MNKKLQDLVWACLPREFKEEVKETYREYTEKIATTSEPEYRIVGYIAAQTELELLFGHHNLTSDAEGEEILTCEKSKAMHLYSHLLDLVENERMSEHYSEWCDLEKEYIALFGENVFADYFGSKCLPDELNKKITMESRNVTLTLQKAKEFYNSGNDALKEVALQAFTKEELTTPKYTNIKTFEDACKALGLNMDFVNFALCNMKNIEGGFGKHLTAIYKLDIIRKALNGADWNPKMAEGDIYYGWVRFYEKSSNIPSNKKIIGNFIADGQKYLLVGGFGTCGYCDGLGSFGSMCRYGNSHADLSLLCCKSLEIAQYMSEQFGKIIFEACYAHHVGSYQWVR